MGWPDHPVGVFAVETGNIHIVLRNGQRRIHHGGLGNVRQAFLLKEPRAKVAIPPGVSSIKGVWQSIGIDAVCGAEGSNVLTIFSPAYFIEEWTSGKSFDAAVQAAQQREITTLRSYNNKVPTEAFFLNSTNLQNSKQSMGGSNSNILWKQIPVSML